VEIVVNWCVFDSITVEEVVVEGLLRWLGFGEERESLLELSVMMCQ
jgi:hypothetical protein